MRLDDLARRAAERTRSRAGEAAARMDATRYREGRRRVGYRLAATAAAGFALVALGVALLSVPEVDEVAVSTTLPDSTTVTTTGVTTTVPGDDPDPGPPTSILGAGWEELDAGPIEGRYRVATAWTGSELFVWGGDTVRWYSPPDDPALHRQDGFLFDPATGAWRPVAPLPDGVCRLTSPTALAAGDVIVLRGAAAVVNDCTTAAAYDPATGSWEPLHGEFFSRLGSLVSVVWTGEMLVAPRQQLAYHWTSRQTIDLPAFPAGQDDAVFSPQRAHWTGDRVLAIGSGSLRAWVPGDEAWTLLDAAPVPDRARDSAWTDQGLLVVNYQMAAAFYAGEAWSRPGDLPLRFFECLPEAVSVGGTPAVRTCSGVAIWDEIRGSWIPVALDDVADPTVGWGPVVGSDDSLYVVGPRFRRFRIDRHADGWIVVPPTIPIGVMQLDIPEGFGFVSSFAPEQDPAGFIPEDETVGVVFEAEAGRTCTVSSTSVGDVAFDGAIGTVSVERPGRSPLEAHEYLGVEGGVGLAVAASTSDVVMVFCENPPPSADQELARSDALAFVRGLWSPWEEPPSEPEPYVARGACGTDNMPEGWQDDAVKLGPLWLWHVAPPGRGNGADRATKTIAVLEPGAQVTLSVAPSYRHRAGHLFDPSRWNDAGAYRVATQGNMVTFLPCDDEDAEFVGGFVFTGETCIEVTVTVGDAAPFRAALPFDAAPCSEEIDTRSPSDCATSAPYLTGVAAALPRKGQTTEERVRGIVESDRDAILQHLFTEYFVRAVDARVIERRGEVWDWVDTSTGEYRIERALDFQIEVLLDTDEPCPEIGTRWEGIPIVFNRAWVVHERRGLRFETPRDWFVADAPLAPDQTIGLSQVFAAGTYPLRPGTELCDFYPQFAFDDLGRTDALIMLRRLQGGGQGGRPVPGPVAVEPFTYDWLDENGEIGNAACVERTDYDDLYVRWAWFNQWNLVMVALGPDVSDDTRAQVLRILDSMEWVDD